MAEAWQPTAATMIARTAGGTVIVDRPPLRPGALRRIGRSSYRAGRPIFRTARPHDPLARHQYEPVTRGTPGTWIETATELVANKNASSGDRGGLEEFATDQPAIKLCGNSCGRTLVSQARPGCGASLADPLAHLRLSWPSARWRPGPRAGRSSASSLARVPIACWFAARTVVGQHARRTLSGSR